MGEQFEDGEFCADSGVELTGLTFNVSDRRLRLTVDGRLTQAEWFQLKTAGFQSWPKQRVITALYTPDRMDVIGNLFCYGESGAYLDDQDIEVIELDEEEMAAQVESGNAERLERLEIYKANAEARAAANFDRAHAVLDRIPLGQPILVGHHSEGRASSDQRRVDNAMRTAVEEMKRADYWALRVEGAVGRQKQKYNRGVVARRVAGMESEERVLRRDMDLQTAKWSFHGGTTEEIKDSLTGQTKYRYVAPPREEIERQWNAHVTRQGRILHFLLLALAYQRALLAFLGGIPVETIQEVAVGQQVYVWGRPATIQKVNAKTCLVQFSDTQGGLLKVSRNQVAIL